MHLTTFAHGLMELNPNHLVKPGKGRTRELRRAKMSPLESIGWARHMYSTKAGAWLG